ncbi:hypothetical protein DL770_004447 [Monosporascus sp. CRB-9-2]|nr:hypothetical protein DL770_004447 [Monosporascus sp. CRB-9-2]
MAANPDQPASPKETTAGPQQSSAADSTGALYRAFDSYPWQKDRAFTTQLLAALHSRGPDDGLSLSETALQARIRRFEEQTKVRVDADSYRQWQIQTNALSPRLVPEETVIEEAMAVPNPEERRLAHLLVELGDALGTLSLQYQHGDPGSQPVGEVASLPSWQTAAPKADLYIQKETSRTDPEKEPYPKKFEEIIEFLQTGKEIPGIRKIPDTVIEDPTISAQGRLKAPPKPWEIGRVPDVDVPAPVAGEGGE